MLSCALLLTCCDAYAQSDEACKKWALYKEARGESIRVLRAVLDVIDNRVAKSGKRACRVLREPSQFPYFKYGVKKVDFSFTVVYNQVVTMRRVLPESYTYFNHKRHPWGKNTLKIGNIYFSE